MIIEELQHVIRKWYISEDLGEAMVGINVYSLTEDEKMAKTQRC